MTIAASLLTNWLLVTSWLVYIAFVVLALRYAPYHALFSDPRKQHFLYASSIILALFWLLEIQVSAGFAIHPLLITATVLIFGWSLTLISASIALAFITLLGRADWAAFPLNAILTFAVPATVSWLVLTLLNSLRFRNLFIYMLGAGFAGAALSVAATGLLGAGLFHLLDSPLLPTPGLSNLPLILLIMFPEGFINGTLVTAMTVFFPDMVKTFDDRDYLDRP